jgi:hypothetical protein
MPVLAWIMGKLVLMGGYAVVYGPPVLGVALTALAAVKLGEATGDAMTGASQVGHGSRVDLASPKDVEDLQKQHDQGQVKQHVALAEAANQVPQLVSGTSELSAKGVGGTGVNRPDRDVLETEPIDTLTEPWTDPAFIPKGPSSVSALEWGALDGEPEVGKQMALTLIARGVGDAADVTLRVAGGEASLSQATLHMERGESAACDIAGSEAVCGVFITPNRGRPIVVEASSGSVVARLTIEFDTVTVKGQLRMTSTSADQATVDAGIQFTRSDLTVRFPAKGGELTAEGSETIRVDWQVVLGDWQEGPCVTQSTLSITLRGSASGAALADTGTWGDGGAPTTVVTGCEVDDDVSVDDSEPLRFEGSYDEDAGTVTLRIYSADEDELGELYILFQGTVE